MSRRVYLAEFLQKLGHCVANRFAPTQRNLLRCGNEERQHHANECCALYESGSQDHVCADVTCCFGLTGDALNRFATDLTDTETCADYCEACTNCCVHN